MSKDFLDRDRLVSSAKDFGGRSFHYGLDTLGDFRKFILRGNVVDLAVGVVIGAAFNGLVQEFVNDFIKPLLSYVVNVKNFDDFTWGPKEHLFYPGRFLGAFLTFLITAAVIYFFVVKPINSLEDRFNRLRPKKEETPTTRECPFCLSTVPLKATRCAYCTAQLPPADQPTAQVTG